MCGIAVAYALDRGSLPDERVVHRMVARQRHRGPDSIGVVTGPRYHLGSNRLRIVDPRPAADQPVSSDERDVHAILNGELFNHQDIREPLLRAGARFRTGSDTETLLHAYLAYGVNVLAKLEGQFALCVVDERRGLLLLARDALGICPLYYVEHQDVVYVASSMEALLGGVPGITWSLDREAVAEYLLLRFTLAPRTVVRQIRQVTPAEAIVFEGGQKWTLQHWQVSEVEPGEPDDVEEELRERLGASVQQNATCEVPIGAFLSGGLDSSIVVGLASRGRLGPLDTLSIHLGDDADCETAHAVMAAQAFGCRHQVYRVEEQERSALLRACLDAMDHPTGARDAVATYAMARRLKELSPAVKVVLTGTGADELFAGYSSAYFRAIPGSIEAQCAAYVRAYSCTSPGAWLALCDVVVEPLPVDEAADNVAARVRRLSPALNAGDPTNVLCAFYLACHLPGWELGVQDTMCMASSLEPRVPFLGRRVVDLAMAIAGHRKFQPGQEKAVLRSAFRGILPDAIRSRPKLPLSRLVASSCHEGSHEVYRSIPFRDRGIFRLERLHLPSTLAEFDVTWRILALERWLQRNFD